MGCPLSFRGAPSLAQAHLFKEMCSQKSSLCHLIVLSSILLCYIVGLVVNFNDLNLYVFLLVFLVHNFNLSFILSLYLLFVLYVHCLYNFTI